MGRDWARHETQAPCLKVGRVAPRAPLAFMINTVGRVASLHIHPPVAGEPFIEVTEFNLVAEKGITEDKRYFGRVNHGKPAKRQVSLIERKVIEQHAEALGANFDP